MEENGLEIAFDRKLFRLSTEKEIEEWQRGWLDAGGVLHTTERRPKGAHFGSEIIVTALVDFPGAESFGANSFSVIVPSGVKWTNVTSKPGAIGHNSLYFLDGFKCYDDFFGWITPDSRQAPTMWYYKGLNIGPILMSKGKSSNLIKILRRKRTIGDHIAGTKRHFNKLLRIT